ncbi:hypothetical protein T4D_12208 [Trichinella pseudospiralis]|uniref:Uncharacterized protein n=1 Tax=Trichinella pseudospiralis TaxID=6337 RepID=A0A0V1FIZ5_TRIPS|nr:hypothetical protein T4D_12208 [Trichinella pseudospiralis]
MRRPRRMRHCPLTCRSVCDSWKSIQCPMSQSRVVPPCVKECIEFLSAQIYCQLETEEDLTRQISLMRTEVTVLQCLISYTIIG